MINKGDTYTHTFKVTADVYEGFIELFGDKNTLHVDEDFAKQKGFTGKVMHGNILNGFVSYFIGECLPVKNVIIQRQEINYCRPVYLNTELIFTATVRDYFESVKTFEFSFKFENKQNEKIAKGKISIGII